MLLNTSHPTFYLHVAGCKVNQVEAAMLKQQFERRGFCYVDDMAEAQIVILHTCTVTHKADRDCRHMINRVEQKNPDAFIVITGCLAALEAPQLSAQPRVLAVIDQSNRYRAVDIVLEKLNDQGLGIQAHENKALGSSDPGFFNCSDPAPLTTRARAFVKIQDGCNGVCTYCRVRLARGKSISRDQHDVINELKAYQQKGYQEIVLTGVNLAAYQPGLGHLLDEIDQIEGQWRIRLSSLEPQYMTTALLEKLIHYQSWLCPHVHIPIQSGSDKILTAMKRPYRTDTLKEKLWHLKEHWPNLTFTADMIVGFPGEQEDDFKRSLSLAEELLLSKIHVFPFSPRPGTQAAVMPDKVINRTITNRAKEMRQLSDQLQHQHHLNLMGKATQVLLEQQDKGGYWLGTTGDYQKAKIKIKGRAGQLVNATIQGVEGQLLVAR